MVTTYMLVSFTSLTGATRHHSGPRVKYFQTEIMLEICSRGLIRARSNKVPGISHDNRLHHTNSRQKKRKCFFSLANKNALIDLQGLFLLHAGVVILSFNNLNPYDHYDAFAVAYKYLKRLKIQLNNA